jgi:hypothetical protein
VTSCDFFIQGHLGFFVSQEGGIVNSSDKNLN